MKRLIAAGLLLLIGTSCSALGHVSHSHVTDFSGVNGIRGVPIEYQTTTTYALHLLFIFPLAGDASTSRTIEEFSKEAAARGGDRIQFVQNSSSTYWYIFPPISFFVHPVVTTVEGEVEGVAQDFDLLGEEGAEE